MTALRMARYALSAFLSIYGNAEGLRLVTPDEAAELAQRNQPFAHSPEEQARLDRIKVKYCAGEIVRHMRLHDLDEAEAARKAELTDEQMRGLLEWDVARISADEADRALVRLLGTAYGWVSPEPGQRFEVWGSGNTWEDLELDDIEDEDGDEPAEPDGRRKPW